MWQTIGFVYSMLDWQTNPTPTQPNPHYRFTVIAPLTFIPVIQNQFVITYTAFVCHQLGLMFYT